MRFKRKTLLLILAAVLSAFALFGCAKEAAPSAPDAAGQEAAPSSEADSGKEGSSASSEAGDLTSVSVGSFTTEDLDGNPVTESILAEKEYTMINIWGTYCGPCINEMPELEEIHQSLPENMQILGIICDLPYEIDIPETEELAKEIVELTGVTYPSLKVWSYANWFYDTTSVVPTTYFVDAEGNLVSDIIFGADVEAYKKTIESLGK